MISETMRRSLKYVQPEQLPMYVSMIMKCKTVQCSVGYEDELGGWWTHAYPVWYFELRYVGSNRKYGLECVQARTKQQAIKKIKLLWRVERIDR